MDLYLAPRAGIWCRSLSGWDAFRAALGGTVEPEVLVPEPVPNLLPAREGRRAPLHVRLAIEVGIHCCRENGIAPADVRTVFASAMGDTAITDYMCRTLAGPVPMLSPTRFHNSVHNAASGYWSIGAVNRLPASAIAAGEWSSSAGLLEACAMAAEGEHCTLLVVHDVAAPGPLAATSGNRQPFAAALLVSAHQPASAWHRLSVGYAPAAAWPLPATPWLRQLATQNDSARGLALLEGLAAGESFSLRLPLGRASSLDLNCT